ncbi:MAG: hypothetical protein M3198_08910, partial [Actinomycetota bacterium]|nr:hypothetical protein [Actinomycetota bacterium]
MGGQEEPEGPRGPGRSPLLLALLAFGFFVLAAAALPEGLSLFDEDASDRAILPSVPRIFQYLIAGVGALMVVTLILLRVTVMRDEVNARSSQRTRWRFVALA